MRSPLGTVFVVTIIVVSCGRAPTSNLPLGTASGVRSASPSPAASCPGSGPSHRSNAAAAFDSGHGVTVLFGGDIASSSTTNETWLFDGRCWQQVHPATVPAPRSGAGMVYDPTIARTLLIGGRSKPPLQPDYPQDAWTWDGNNWTPVQGAPQIELSGGFV